MITQQQLSTAPAAGLTRAPRYPTADVADARQLSSSSTADSGPAIAITRPSLVAASVDDSALSSLRTRFQEESRNRSSSLSVDGFLKGGLTNKISRSAQNSPKLQRRPSFKVKKLKLFRTPSSGLDGYSSLNNDFADEATKYSREKVTSLSLSRSSSFSAATTPPSPVAFRYRAMTFTPAKNRVIQFDSSSDEEGGGDCSPPEESDLDFGLGTRTKPAQVSFWLCYELIHVLCLHTALASQY